MVNVRMILGVMLLGAAWSASANVISFNERFALADDRSTALKELIPGTVEYYYYNALHLEHLGQFAESKHMIDAGIKKYKHNDQLRELEYRHALKVYDSNPKYSLEFIRKKLGLNFGHQQQKMNPEVRFPATLKPSLISFDSLAKYAFKEHRNTQRFEDTAFDYLVTAKLNPDQRRDLLSRLTRPDYPGLVSLIIDDLKYKHSGGFGSFSIHAALTIEQLEKCLILKRELINETNFIVTYLSKLIPSEDENWRVDDDVYAEYLQRLLAFVERLPSNHRSLKANILYKQLEFNLSQGVYDQELFERYLTLPRHAHYISRTWLDRKEHRNDRVDLNRSYEQYTALRPIGNDEALVRRHLMHFLKDAPNSKAYAEVIESNYLKRLFAETKLVNDIGDAEQWFALMDNPSLVKSLRDRIDLELLPTNNDYISADDEVALAVALKNIEELRIKIYEINTTGFYRQHLTEVTTAIELDGLVPNMERVQTFNHPPMHRIEQVLDLPEITEPGVYVIELIGNGVSSRAVIHRGNLTFTQRYSAAGHAFRVYDETGKHLDDATLWMAGVEYKTENGEIMVPYTGQLKTVAHSGHLEKESIVLSQGNFSVLGRFYHMIEHYELQARMHVERENLRSGEQCSVIIRPELLINRQAADLSLLENVRLLLRTKDLDGHDAEKLVNDFVLENDKEATYSFRVPERLREVSLELSAEIQNLSSGETEHLSAVKKLAVNRIHETEKVADIFLRTSDEGFFLELLGRNAEVQDHRGIQLDLKHRDFKQVVHVWLKTDEKGRSYLGALDGIDWIKVKTPEGVEQRWRLPRDQVVQAPQRHMLTQDTLRVPVVLSNKRPLHQRVSLLEVRGGHVVRDCIEHVILKDGFLIVEGLSAGDYTLVTKPEGRTTYIRVTEGVADGDQLLGKHRILERKGEFPLQIQNMEINGGELIVRLAHALPDSRVHVGMTRFVSKNIFKTLGEPRFSQANYVQLVQPESQYVSGRKIGDEYRYVMERKQGMRFPGNMLTRPSLILNPWSPRSTNTETDEAKGGEDYEMMAREEAALMSSSGFGDFGEGGGGSADHFSCFDFLSEGSPMITNLRPDENGEVRVKLEDLPAGQQLHVYAVHGSSAVYRQRAVAEHTEKPKDLRLTRYLAPDQHFAEQKRSSVLRAGETFTAADALSAKVEVVDSVAAAYRLLSAINGDATFTEFNFITKWSDFSAKKKQELYKEYACHELHLFLAKKDPEFFDAVVRPYLASKKDATFMDDWLLGRPLHSYLEPWAYGRLNVVEKVLLAKQLKSQQASTAQHLKDLFDLLPPDVEKSDRLFNAALRSSGLEEVSEALGRVMRKAKQKAAVAGSGRNLNFANLDDDVVLSALSAPAAPKSRAFKSEMLMESDAASDELGGFGDDFGAQPATAAFGVAGSVSERQRSDASKRQQVRQLYKKLEKTKEWVENNYYKQLIQLQQADLVKVDAFWAEYARWDSKEGFLSGQLVEAGDSFTEMMLALAVLDLPFEAGEHAYRYEDGGLVIEAASDALVFHKQVQPIEGEVEEEVLLVNQRFFAQNDRYTYEHNEKIDKFVADDFEKGRVYGCKLVLTNPTSTARKVDVLQQIPAGAIPVLRGMKTGSRHAVLEAYSTQAQEYFFYFPEAGTFPHFPAHVAQNGKVLAVAEPIVFNVVDQLDETDEESWEHISQYGSEKQVLHYLNTHNIDRLDLNKIAWRMKDHGFFKETLKLLEGRKVYNPTLWSYSLRHNEAERIREYLPQTHYAARCGQLIDSLLLTLDPIARHAYVHKEYWPLVNARVYMLGGERKILNTQFHGQYENFMKVLSYRPDLTVDDNLSVVVYLLLQDRVEEALNVFEGLDSAEVKARVQYDYLSAYLAFYKEQPEEAQKIATAYKDYPVERWQKLFADVLAQCEEISGQSQSVVDEKSRDQLQAQLADTAPRLQFELEGQTMKIDHANLANCTVNYYPMDIELLFSRQPFVQDVGRQFSVIQPNRSDVLTLTGDTMSAVQVAEELKDRNLMIEVSGAGISVQQAYYPNALKVELVESYGHLRIADVEGGDALSKVYVKVYARMNSGEVRFFKDGYTDLRGRFDYTSLNTDELDQVDRFALLIMSDTHGAMVKEAAPPKR